MLNFTKLQTDLWIKKELPTAEFKLNTKLSFVIYNKITYQYVNVKYAERECLFMLIDIIYPMSIIFARMEKVNQSKCTEIFDFNQENYKIILQQKSLSFICEKITLFQIEKKEIKELLQLSFHFLISSIVKNPPFCYEFSKGRKLLQDTLEIFSDSSESIDASEIFDEIEETFTALKICLTDNTLKKESQRKLYKLWSEMRNFLDENIIITIISALISQKISNKSLEDFKYNCNILRKFYKF